MEYTLQLKPNEQFKIALYKRKINSVLALVSTLTDGESGDSIIQHVHGWELSDGETHVAVKSFSEAKTEDMEDYLKPLIRKEPEEIILHIGTNNVKGQESAHMVAEHIVNLGLQIQQNSPKTKVTISGLTINKKR